MRVTVSSARTMAPKDRHESKVISNVSKFRVNSNDELTLTFFDGKVKHYDLETLWDIEVEYEEKVMV